MQVCGGEKLCNHLMPIFLLGPCCLTLNSIAAHIYFLNILYNHICIIYIAQRPANKTGIYGNILTHNIYMGQSVLFCYHATMTCGVVDQQMEMPFSPWNILQCLHVCIYFASILHMCIYFAYAYILHLFYMCLYILHKYRAYFLSFSYLEQHLCLFQTDDSLTRVLFQTINHVLEGDHRDLHQHHEDDDDDNDDGDDDNDQSSP